MAWVLTDVTTAVNLTAETDASSVNIAHRAYAETSRLTAKILDEAGSLTIAVDHEILLTDGGVTAFAGDIRVCRKADRGVSTQRVYGIEAVDYTGRLGDDVVDSTTGIRANGESDKARIAAVGAAFGTRGVVYSGATIIQLRAVMPDQDFRGLNLHQVMTQICAVTGGSFYVDFTKVLHYFNSEAISAPFGLSDNPNGSTTFGYEDFSLADDTAQYVNAVYVQGTGIADWRPSAAAVATLRSAGTLRATTVNDPEITTATDLAAVGDALLAQYGAIRQPSSLVTYTPGLRAGQNVQITHAGWSISAVTYRVASIEAIPIDANRIRYQVFFGANPLSLGDLLRQQSLSIAEAYLQGATANGGLQQVLDLSTGGANLVPNSSFEDGSAWVVGSGWTIDFVVADAYQGASEARLVLAAATGGILQTPFITVDRLDSYWASAWIFCRARTAGLMRAYVVEYNAANAVLATTQLGSFAAAGAGWVRVSKKFENAADLGAVTWQATTAKVRVLFDTNGASATGTWSVDGVQLERGNLLTAYGPSPYELYAGQVGTTQIADDAVTTPKLIANAVAAGKIAANAVTAAEIAANAVTADKIAAQSVHIYNMATPVGNFAPNGDFEDISAGAVGVNGVAVRGWGTLHAAARLRGDNFKYGMTSLEFVRPGSTTALDQRSMMVPVQGGRRIIVRGWVRGTAGNNAASAVLIATEAFKSDLSAASTANPTNSGSIVVGVSTTWTEVVRSGATSSDTAFVRVLLRQVGAVGGTTDAVRFDSIEVYYADDDIIQSAGDVVIDTNGIAITNGKLVVTNPSATVIIDGTSDIFKIIATGTLVVSGVNGSGPFGGMGTTGVNLATGLTYRPQVIGMFDDTTRYPGEAILMPVPNANMDNGAVGSGEWVDNDLLTSKVYLTNLTQIRERWETRYDRSGSSSTYRYYLLLEIAF
jgi:hypothetical protein